MESKKKFQQLVDAISISNAENVREINFLKAYAHNTLQQQKICTTFRIRLYIEIVMAIILSGAGAVIVIMELNVERTRIFPRDTTTILCMVLIAILFEALSGLLLWLSRDTIQQLKQYRDDLYKNEQLLFILGVVDLASTKKNQEKDDIRDLYMRVVESELRKREQSARL